MIFKIIFTTQTPKGSYRRCSRPLCSSQSTGGTPSTPHQPVKPKKAQRNSHQPPSPKTDAISARPLRTQQRACIKNSEPDHSCGKPRTKPENIISDTKSN